MGFRLQCTGRDDTTQCEAGLKIRMQRMGLRRSWHQRQSAPRLVVAQALLTPNHTGCTARGTGCNATGRYYDWY